MGIPEGHVLKDDLLFKTPSSASLFRPLVLQLQIPLYGSNLSLCLLISFINGNQIGKNIMYLGGIAHRRRHTANGKNLHGRQQGCHDKGCSIEKSRHESMGYTADEIVKKRHLAPDFQHSVLKLLHLPAFLLLHHLSLHQSYGAKRLLHLFLISRIVFHHSGNQLLQSVSRLLHQHHAHRNIQQLE